MKKLLLITVLLVAITTKGSAQDHTIIDITKNENNQFEITAKSDMNIHLKFNLESQDVCSVSVCDKRMNEVPLKKKYKKGEYKIAFTIEEGEQYIVRFSGVDPIRLITKTIAEN
ncbi:hypothetical protein [Flavobacterium nackdongense]|uniref:DUF3244 domain-containing protein n=1 Tax=Flavobacterium nackdongense TaxID=2547394 RepID=A0A4P6YCB7_9FLAO|nr:hypothetical protein [Flavobacterium nackdongense]QBN19898.1 hypothetical protein E1750_14180 [Flavobacterium nackdongense]